MEQKIARKDPAQAKQEENDQLMKTRIYLENDTLAIISNEDLAFRRLDLENCDILQLPTAQEFHIYYKLFNENKYDFQNSGIKIIAISKLIDNKENEDLNKISEVLKQKLTRWNKEL